MTATAAPPRRPRPAAHATLRQLYAIVLRMQLTPLRLLGVAALGGIGLLLGVLTGRDDDPVAATAEMAAEYGIAVAIPLCVLWLATSSVGDLVDDGLLVYLWLKPVARWQLPAAAMLASATIVLSLVVLPLVVATLVAGVPDVLLGVAVAPTLATLANAGLIDAAGLLLRRALWWASEGAARLSVGGYARSALARIVDVELELGGRSLVLSLAVLVAVAIAGWLAAADRYRRAEIA